MLVIAHLSDAHIGPLPPPSVRELMGKRLTGYVNWRRGRNTTHDMEVLDSIIADIDAQQSDHIAFTGDIVNIGLTTEFPAAQAFMTRLGPPERVSFVPGNHDAYVRGSLKPLGRSLGPWMTGDGSDDSVFPYIRRRDGVALIGLSSAVPTLPFLASGTLGRNQLAALEEILAALRDEGLCRVVLVHHPPYRRGAKPGRELTDAGGFETVMRRVGAELVLHGHNHCTSLVHVAGPERPVPVLGAPSASAIRGTRTHSAGYHVLTIDPDGKRSAIAIRSRGLMPNSRNVGDLGGIAIDGPSGSVRRP
jgi:3',5'-cyclic AMP phosphodiesterase CpdA